MTLLCPDFFFTIQKYLTEEGKNLNSDQYFWKKWGLHYANQDNDSGGIKRPFNGRGEQLECKLAKKKQSKGLLFWNARLTRKGIRRVAEQDKKDGIGSDLKALFAKVDDVKKVVPAAMDLVAGDGIQQALEKLKWGFRPNWFEK